MPFIVIVEKTGDAKEQNIKDHVFNEATLYKKIGLKTNANFECLYQNNGIMLFGKKSGKKNYLNIFPFGLGFNIYGSCIMLKVNDSANPTTICDYKLDDFTKSQPFCEMVLQVPTKEETEIKPNKLEPIENIVILSVPKKEEKEVKKGKKEKKGKTPLITTSNNIVVENIIAENIVAENIVVENIVVENIVVSSVPKKEKKMEKLKKESIMSSDKVEPPQLIRETNSPQYLFDNNELREEFYI
jgi:hypothetical protein